MAGYGATFDNYLNDLWIINLYDIWVIFENAMFGTYIVKNMEKSNAQEI